MWVAIHGSLPTAHQKKLNVHTKATLKDRAGGGGATGAGNTGERNQFTSWIYQDNTTGR